MAKVSVPILCPFCVPRHRESYVRHVRGHAVANSRKASSYLRALDLLGPVLAKAHGPFSAVTSLWETASIPLLTDLYAYVHRLNPANGLCLSATYDAAFDAHLISFDEDLRLILSPNLREFVDDEAVIRHFKALEGGQVAEARRFRPDQGFMALHREKMCA